MEKLELGIDMGGTHTAAGLVRGRVIVDRVEFPTETSDGADACVSVLFENIQKLLKGNQLSLTDISHAGMGVPGSFNRETGMVEYANNLGFSKVPFQAMLAKKLGMEVCLDNDANLAAYGEYLLSKSKADSFLMITLGTGIGCGMILKGEIYRGVNFAEGEIGHMTIKYDGISCNCGRKGCFEAYASTNALVKMACDAMRKRPKTTCLWNSPRIDGRAFFDAVEAKDGAMLGVLDEYTSLLAEGITNIINIFQPEELVIGGGISARSELFLPDVIRKVRAVVYSKESAKNTRIRASEYGNDAGIIGAAKFRV